MIAIRRGEIGSELRILLSPVTERWEMVVGLGELREREGNIEEKEWKEREGEEGEGLVRGVGKKE